MTDPLRSLLQVSHLGQFSGEQRLADSIEAAAAAGRPASGTVRRLERYVLRHQADRLQDDASTVVLERLTGTGRRPRP